MNKTKNSFYLNNTYEHIVKDQKKTIDNCIDSIKLGRDNYRELSDSYIKLLEEKEQLQRKLSIEQDFNIKYFIFIPIITNGNR